MRKSGPVPLEAKVYFVGAGPGDPDLITVKGARILAGADLVLYAGSLLAPGMLAACRPGAELHDSAKMTLEEMVPLMASAVRQGRSVARIASGDPTIYGALHEQMEALDKAEIPYEIVPGVTSATAAAAALGIELTVPDIAQSVILTRLEGKTKMPQGEKLSDLARHQTTMVIFLSTQNIREVVDELMQGYPPETPVAVVQKASWGTQEKIVRGTLADIAEKVKKAKIVWTAVVIVGAAAGRGSADGARLAGRRSRLYAPDFSHGYRQMAEGDTS